ncbi:hypothetical protein D9M68_844360 [compost metagenome]
MKLQADSNWLAGINSVRGTLKRACRRLCSFTCRLRRLSAEALIALLRIRLFSTFSSLMPINSPIKAVILPSSS